MSTLKPRINVSTVWTSTNPILKENETGIESDTGKMKIGDSLTNWNSLSYANEVEPLRTGRYEHHIQNVLSASTGWWGYRYNAATATKWSPYFETGYWDGTSLNYGFRGWADVIEYDQEVTSVTLRQIRNTVETKVHIVYFEIVGANCVNAQLIKEIILPADASGFVKEIEELPVTPFTMSKNGLITAFYNNNNLLDAISHLSFYINYKEVRI